MGKDVEEISNFAFWGCTSLEEINFTDQIKKIGYEAFYGCEKLSDLYIGKLVEKIDDTAFAKCSGLKNVEVNSKNKNFVKEENGVLNAEKTKWILGEFGTDTTCHISEKVTEINIRVLEENIAVENFSVSSKNKKFSSEKGLLYSKDGKTLHMCPRGKKTATISDKATKMQGVTVKGGKLYVFRECEKLEKVVIGKNMSNIEKFSGCKNLKQVKVVKGNKNFTHAKGAILSKNKKKLLYCLYTENGTYTVPKGVTKISKVAFNYCYNLKKIILSDEMTGGSIDCAGAKSIKLGKRYYNKGDLSWISENIDNWDLERVSVSSKNPYYSAVGGIVYNKKKTKLLKCPPRAAKCDMPDTVTKIDKDAFDVTMRLSEFSVSDKMTEINLSMIAGTFSKVKLHIGKKVKTLKGTGSVGLEKITVASKNKYYKVKDEMLYTKDGKRLICCLTEKKGEVEISDGTEVIGESAFLNTNGIIKIVMPDTITKIEKNAFGEGNEDIWIKGVYPGGVFCVSEGKKEFYQSLLTQDTGFIKYMTIKEVEQ